LTVRFARGEQSFSRGQSTGVIGHKRPYRRAAESGHSIDNRSKGLALPGLTR